jgi:hypothetical protein
MSSGTGTAPATGRFTPLSLEHDLSPPPAKSDATRPPAHQAPFSENERQALDEWVGEPTPIQTRKSQRRQTSRKPDALRPVGLALDSAASLPDAGEWVGEPTPMTRLQGHAPRLRPLAGRPPLSDGPEENAEETTDQASSSPSRQQDAPAERPGEPAPMTDPLPAPTAPQRDFVPLRLADPPRAFPTPGKPFASEAPEEPAPLFPHDNTLLGFVLEEHGADARGTTAPSPSTRLARAAQGLANFVRQKENADQPESVALQRARPAAEDNPVAGLSEGALEQMQPLIPGLLASLDEAMENVRRGFRHSDPIAVEMGAARIAARADNYGLRVLARMARCVEMAARARDKDALVNILPELETAVERNRIALQPKK